MSPPGCDTRIFQLMSVLRRGDGARRARTADLLIANQALSQLSYSPAAVDCSAMLAVVLDGSGQPELAEIPAPEGSLRMLASGLCGSDVEKIGRAPAGTVLGHEVVAERDGERVVLVHHLPCGECGRCRAGHESTCERFSAATIVPGGFAERIAAVETIELTEGIEDALGTYVEPLACVLRGVERVPRGRVLVVGQGFVGRLFAEVLRRRGDDVFAMDTRPERGGREPDGLVDAAVLCAPAAPLAAVSPGGTVLVFADAGPIDLNDVYRRELTLVGSRSATPASMRAALALLPTLNVPEPTVLPLERFHEGVELYRSGQALKIVFVP
jgi:L-iditol 2-dehydrogenase